MATKKVNGVSVKAINKLIKKLNIKTDEDVNNLLDKALNNFDVLSPEEKSFVIAAQQAGYASPEKLQALIEENNQFTVSKEQYQQEIDRLNERIAELEKEKTEVENELKYSDYALEAYEGNLGRQIRKNQIAVDNKSRDQGIKTLNHKITQLQIELNRVTEERDSLLKKLEYEKRAKGHIITNVKEAKAELLYERRAKENAIAESNETKAKLLKANIERSKLATKNKRVSRASKIFAVALILSAGLNVAFGIQNNKQQKQLDETNQIVDTLRADQQAVNTKLANVIKTLGVLESQAIADQKAGTAVQAITIFGENYVANLSEYGKQAYADGKDANITLEYFATSADAVNFVDGYINEFMDVSVLDLRAQVEELKTTIANQNISIEEKDAQIDELASVLESTRDELETTKLALTEEITSLTAQLTAVSAEKDAWQAKYENLVAASNGSTAELLNQIEELQTHIDNLTDEYNTLYDQYVVLVGNEETIAKQLETIENLENLVDELEAKVSQLEAENNQPISGTTNKEEETNTPVSDKDDLDNSQSQKGEESQEENDFGYSGR